MVRKIAVAVASAVLSTAAFAQMPMQDTWDINAPNGAPMALGNLLPTASAPAALAGAPMHDTWDIDAPNGPRFMPAPAAVASYDDPHVHGYATSAGQADRVIEVGPGTRHVNVDSGETVLFKVGDKSFTWTFEPTLSHPTFDLGQIAPEGIAVQGVTIYCAPDLYERAG